jgi:hypothetical protein
MSEVRSLLSPDDLWNALTAGGYWMDPSESIKSLPAFRLTTFLSVIDINKFKSGKNQIMLVPFVERTAYGGSEISPLMSKVSQESGLRHFTCRTYLNPKTADRFGIVEGCRVLLQTNNGSKHSEARLDDSVMPGIVGVSNTMNPQSLFTLCETNSDASICPTPVIIQKV